MRIIEPGEFISAFNTVSERRLTEITDTWENSTKFTALMLNDKDSVCHQVASLLNLHYFREYWTIDAIFYEEKDEKHFSSTSTFAKHISVALEHENTGIYAHSEMNKLTMLNAPLKILVTYIARRSYASKLREFAEIAQQADIFQDFDVRNKIILVLGYRDTGALEWHYYQFDGKQFYLVQKDRIGS